MNKIKKVLCFTLLSMSATNFVYSSENLKSEIESKEALLTSAPKCVTDFEIVKQMKEHIFVGTYNGKYFFIKSGINTKTSSRVQKLIDNYDKIKDCPYLMHPIKIYNLEKEKHEDWEKWNSLSSFWQEVFIDLKPKDPNNNVLYQQFARYSNKPIIAYEYINGKNFEEWINVAEKSNINIVFSKFLDFCKGLFGALKLIREVSGCHLGDRKERNIVMRQLEDGSVRPVLVDYGDLNDCFFPRGIFANTAYVLLEISKLVSLDNDTDERFVKVKTLLSHIEKNEDEFNYDDIISQLEKI